MSEDHTEKMVMSDTARHLLDTVPVSPLPLRIIDYNQPEWLAEFNRRGERIAELEKEKSELLAKCEKYECEIGLAKQQIAALGYRDTIQQLQRVVDEGYRYWKTLLATEHGKRKEQ